MDAGIGAGKLASYNINAPTTQSVVVYVLLAITCGVVHLRQHNWRWHMSNPWHVYLLLAVLDVEANFVVTKVI
jgi:solute carrier family 35, member F1/2